MSYEIKERNGKFLVVDMDTKKIRGSYDDEDDAEDRKDELDFRVHVRQRLERIPVAEMTAEEKAAAYDKMMAEQNVTKVDPNIPPPKPDPDKSRTQKKSRYWNSDED